VSPDCSLSFYIEPNSNFVVETDAPLILVATGERNTEERRRDIERERERESERER
jgi:hypothetical protein